MLQRLPFCLLAGVFFAVSCRTTRPVVDVGNERASKPNSDDFPAVRASIDTTFILTAISIPPQSRTHDRLDIRLFDVGNLSEVQKLDYKIGEALSIAPYIDYEVTVRAFRHDVEIYSSSACTEALRIRSELGPNRITAPLCSKATKN